MAYVGVVAGALFFSATADAADSGNRLTVRVLPVRAGVEIHVHSPDGFAIRAQPPLLRIGDRVFGRSYHPADGRLNTLIFLLSRDEYAALPDGEEVGLGHLRSDRSAAAAGITKAAAGHHPPKWRVTDVGDERLLGIFAKTDSEVR